MTASKNPECLVCQVYERQPRIPRFGAVCETCRLRTRSHLLAIDHQFRRLDTTPGSAPRDGRISGNPERTLGVRVAVLDLITPVTHRRSGIYDPHRDQAGHIPVAAVLDEWTRDWIQQRHQAEKPPAPTVPVLTGWLADRLDWACDHHPAIAECAAELRALAGVLRAANGDVTARPEHKPVPCPECEYRTLFRYAGEDLIDCATCGHVLSPAEYELWTKRLVHVVTHSRDDGVDDTEKLV